MSYLFLKDPSQKGHKQTKAAILHKFKSGPKQNKFGGTVLYNVKMTPQLYKVRWANCSQNICQMFSNIWPMKL